jgi:hypothetical protein
MSATWIVTCFPHRVMPQRRKKRGPESVNRCWLPAPLQIRPILHKRLNDADLNAQAERWLERTANRRRHRTTNEAPQLRFDRDERYCLKGLALTPYPRLHGVTVNPAAPKPAYQVDVQRRPLSVYAEAIR